MADRGFTIKDMLHEIGAELNLPPFLEGRKQLPPEEVTKSRSIASLRIHVERAICRMNLYKILSGTMHLKLAGIADQIVTVIAYLSNFHPALVPAPNTLAHSHPRADNTPSHPLTQDLPPLAQEVLETISSDNKLGHESHSSSEGTVESG